MNNQTRNQMSYIYEKKIECFCQFTKLNTVELWKMSPHYGKEDSVCCKKSVHAARPTVVTEQGRRRVLVIIASSINLQVSVTISNDNIQWCSCWLDQCQQCCWKMLMAKKRVDSSRGLEFEGGRKQHWGWRKCNPLHFNVCITIQDLWICT